MVVRCAGSPVFVEATLILKESVLRGRACGIKAYLPAEVEQPRRKRYEISPVVLMILGFGIGGLSGVFLSFINWFIRAWFDLWFGIQVWLLYGLFICAIGGGILGFLFSLSIYLISKSTPNYWAWSMLGGPLGGIVINLFIAPYMTF